jgi:uncharacterized protein
MVLDGIPVEGLSDPKRTPIILSSDGRKADEANLIHDYDIDVTKKEEVDDAASVYPSTAFVPGLAGVYPSTAFVPGLAGVYPSTAFVPGLAGGILSSCLSNGIASKALLIYASRGIPDPEGAAILIDSVKSQRTQA